ncbi:hypothetical protein KDD30_16855 (plasmid) [Photobacterium sp. GJ3]|uniref:hypothetical protein n=1 Tax=Photobacterium sp. GJ3 TaxID=2829502 RepID=UPI001B8B45E3|nr:hypothetical protein [Photobacterium sp. GJ3]QUJ69843.1 hypothetical protein KDD30_16855 [Photobacterium sp. GJ3]
MRLFEPLEELEKNEELLRQQVNALPDEQKKAFYQIQSQKLKDPDTYAALNWFFLGGFHHCYLGKYALFLIELTILIVSVTGFFLGHSSAIYLLLLLVAYELPQLFFSQKIARQYNYQMSCEIFNQVRRS